MSTISIRLNEDDNKLIREYTKTHHMELSEFIRQTIIEKIEEDHDLALFKKVWEEEKNQERYSHEQVKEILKL